MDRLQKYRDKYPGLDFSKSEYRGCRIPLVVVCPKHGEITKTPAHLNVNGCPHCGRESSMAAKRSTKSFSDYNAIHSAETKARWIGWCESHPEFDCSEADYVSADKKVKIVCLKHGETFFPTPRNAMRVGTGCKSCMREKVSAYKNSPERKGKFVAKAMATHGLKYDYSRIDYNGLHDKVQIVCPVHGPFEQLPHNHLHGNGCPSCARSASQYETEICGFLDELGVEYERRNRTVLAPKEIDIWVKSHGVGIEVHGLYWHTEDKVGALHRDKRIMAAAAGITLLQIYEDDLVRRKNAVLNRIKAVLGLHDRLAARKTKVRKIDASSARRFLDERHMQGAGPMGGIYYGLFHDGELVSVMTLGKARNPSMKGTSDGYEILRFASSKAVVGGFSKLLKRFVREYAPERIVSFCDLNHATGEVYRKNGFVLENTSSEQYWWLKGNKAGSRTNRYETQKHIISSGPYAGLSERETAEKLGWKRILGAGTQRWALYPGQAKPA